MWKVWETFEKCMRRCIKNPTASAPLSFFESKAEEGGQRLAEKGRISFWMRVGGRADLSVLALF